MRKFTANDIRGWHDKYEWAREKVINQELQHYLPVNDYNSGVQADGSLRMTALQEHTALGGVIQNYSSAIFQSQGKELVSTGSTVTIRAKLSNMDGIFAAGWLLRTDAVWQKTEIDIFETTKAVKNGEYHIAHHSHTAEGGTYPKLAGSVPTDADLINEFHDYSVKINQDSIEYFFDGKFMMRVPLHEHEQGLTYYILLNVAVAPSGSWAGAPAGTELDWEAASMFIEYITVARDLPAELASPETIEAMLIESGVPDQRPVDAYAAYDILVDKRYENSPRIAQLLYNIARELGGEL